MKSKNAWTASLVRVKRVLLWPAIWSTARLVRRDALIVLNYHQVTPAFQAGRNFPATWTSLRLFCHEVEQLRRSYPLVRLTDGLNDLRAGSLHGAAVALTFDDGHCSLAEHVIPFLVAQRIPATLFVNSKYLDSAECAPELACDYWRHTTNPDPQLRAQADSIDLAILRNTKCPETYWELLREVERLGPPRESRTVSMSFLRALDVSLFEVGLHGHEHYRFSMLDEPSRRKNLQENVQILGHLPAYRPIFALPYGKPHDWDRQTVRLCLELGLDVCLAAGGINRAGDLLVRRIPVDSVGHLGRRLVKETLGV